MTWFPALLDGPLQIVATYTEGVDEKGNPTKAPATWRPEYHLNIPADMLTQALKPYAVDPVNPQRVFAVMPGEDYRSGTAFLVFKDEAEARSVLGEHFTPAVDQDGKPMAEPPVFKEAVAMAASRIDGAGKRNAELEAVKVKP